MGEFLHDSLEEYLQDTWRNSGGIPEEIKVETILGNT